MDNCWLHQDKQQINAMASLVAGALSEDLTVEEIELMRSFLLSVTALLGTIAFQQKIMERECKKGDHKPPGAGNGVDKELNQDLNRDVNQNLDRSGRRGGHRR